MPSQRLGQHFLHDQAAISAIVNSLRIESGDTIIEIGPGRGALTKNIEREMGSRQLKTVTIIGIEKDAALVHHLKNYIVNIATIIHGDALKELPIIVRQPAFPAHYKIVGNIPYYITGRLLRAISELVKKPDLCVLTIQKEVAERIAAHAPHMSILSIATQAWASPEIILSLSPKSFSPPPSVDSAVLRLSKKNISSPILHNFPLVKAGFSHPRKLLISNLSEKLAIPKTTLEHPFSVSRIPLTARAQELPLIAWERLAGQLKKSRLLTVKTG